MVVSCDEPHRNTPGVLPAVGACLTWAGGPAASVAEPVVVSPARLPLVADGAVPSLGAALRVVANIVVRVGGCGGA